MERRDFLKTCSTLAVAGAIGIAIKPNPNEVEVLVADIGGLVYEPIQMFKLEKGDIVKFPNDKNLPDEYQLDRDPELMEGHHRKEDVIINFVQFPPGKERWSRRVTGRVMETWGREPQYGQVPRREYKRSGTNWVQQHPKKRHLNGTA